MRRIIAIILLLTSTLYSNGQLLWKVEGNGLKAPSYIIGTHHLASFSILDSIAGIREAMKNTTQVVGELVMSEAQSSENMQLMQRMIVTDSDSTLMTMLPDTDYVRLNAVVREYLNFEIGMMPKVKPSFIQNNLTVLMYIRNVGGFKPNEQLDAFFQSFAVRQGRKVLGLETPEYQFNLLYNSQSLKRQADQLMCLVNDTSRLLAEAKEITEAYMCQDLDGMYKISMRIENDRCDLLPSEIDEMVYRRNVDWVNKLPELMGGEPTLIVVGALHLPGEKGLIRLLSEKGYRLTYVR